MGRLPESSLPDQPEDLGQLRQRGVDQAEGGVRERPEHGRSFDLVFGHGRFQGIVFRRKVSASKNDSENIRETGKKYW